MNTEVCNWDYRWYIKLSVCRSARHVCACFCKSEWGFCVCLCGGVYAGLETCRCPVAEFNERPHIALDLKSNLQIGHFLFFSWDPIHGNVAISPGTSAQKFGSFLSTVSCRWVWILKLISKCLYLPGIMH